MKFSIGSESAREPEILKVLHSDYLTVGTLANRLLYYFDKYAASRPVVFVCIGTDRSTGDALGPLVGTSLMKMKVPELNLFGTLEEPVHAMNLNDTMAAIQEQFHNPFVIGIDACLGQLSSVGFIQLGAGPLKPGAGVNKELPPVGDIHMTGIVNVGGFMEYFVLQNTRLSLVMSMSETIADSISQALSFTRNVSRNYEVNRAPLLFDL